MLVMSGIPENVYPEFDQFISRAGKEAFLGQKSKVIWLTGLSGSGKSAIAQSLEKMLHEKGILSKVIDGDILRSGLNKDLGFTEAERRENIRRAAEVAKLFLQSGFVTICCFVSPTFALRDLARNIIGSEDFLEVFVNTSAEECERRDVKGLYARARSGEVRDFTGISAPFDVPLNPFADLLTKEKSPDQCAEDLLELILPYIKKD